MSTSSATSKKCPQCGADLPADADVLCPRCLMAQIIQPTGPQDPSAAIPPLSPEEIAPHFPQLEILECLGRGGMGVVYKARQKSLNRVVALKLLAPERAHDASFAQRFTREAHALAALNHPHIVTVYDFGRAGGFYFLLMEFIDGVNLRQAMVGNRFTPEQALAVVPPICEALQYAHEHGIVHRDIKPENLLLDKEGRVKIADFGIAKILGEDMSTGIGESQPAGTPQYMAPEQKDHRHADHRADIYSLGVVLYEMLTGERPKEKIVPPSTRVQMDVRIDEIVLRALERAPELRFQTATEMRTQVETVTREKSHASSAAPAVAAAGPTRRERSPWRWLIFGVLAGMALIFVGLWIPRYLAIRASMEEMRTRILDEEHKLAESRDSQPKAGTSGQRREVVLRKFALTDHTIATDVGPVSNSSGTWGLTIGGKTRAILQAELDALLKSHTEDSPEVAAQRARIEARAKIVSQPRVVRLYEVPNPNIEDCTVLYRAKLMTKDLAGRAYLEMWCRFPGMGEAFSRGLDQTISGSNDWVSCQIPFFLKKGEKPDLIRLNVVIEGDGEVYAKDIELVAVLASSSVSTSLPHAAGSINSTDTDSPIALGAAVGAFNARHEQEAVARGQTALTEDEVVSAIEKSMKDRSKVFVTDTTFTALGRVPQTRVLPPGFELELLTGYEDDKTATDVWSVRLTIPSSAGAASTTSIPIREVRIGSRTFGPEERQVIHDWQEKEKAQGGIGSFERVRYQQERAAAAARDAASSADSPRKND